MQNLHESRNGLQRVVVVGCCGAGKTTFSAELSRRIGIPHVKRDTLGKLGSDEYQVAVAAVVGSPGWVFDGPPYFVDDLVYSNAQLVVWLDYSRPLVVWRAVRRSVRRTFDAPEPGENGWWRLRQWVIPGGPLFAWNVYAARKREFRKLEQHPAVGEKVLRFTNPTIAGKWLSSLEPLEQPGC
jgi:hypothetical protein